MICITINQESRRFALVDMVNSAKQCDLLEIRLDRFGMAPELAELLAHKPAPVIMSCRREQDGGHWDGSEPERLALLRQCIVHKADYVEIELDVADEVRRLPPTKRVISYTVREGDRSADILERYREAQTKDPDVIKLTTSARTPEEAWPLVQILARPPVPTVVVGVGKPGVMLTVLGKKIGAPWTYAALEKGMEAYPGQPTVAELRDVYHYPQIDKGTRLIGVTGFEPREYYTVAGLNAALAGLGLPARCLPLTVGNVELFRKVVGAINLASVVVGPEHQEMLLSLAAERHPTVEHAGAIDLILQKDQKWHGYYSAGQGVVTALAESLKARRASDEPLKGRVVMIVGVTPAARVLAADLSHRKANVILVSREKSAQDLAKSIGCRHVAIEASYNTLHDTLIVCDQGEATTGHDTGLHHGILKEGVTVVDLTAGLQKSALLREAKARGGHIVEPRDILLRQLELQTRMITGKGVAPELLAAAVPTDLEDE